MALNADTGWIMTFSGKKLNPFEPDPSQIVIEDIAHALSNICRYTGHCNRFYSVAEHSYWASTLVPEQYAKQALLHDASEAYLMDIARPIKYHPDMQIYRDTEAKLEGFINEKFGLPEHMEAAVKEVDDRLLISEATYLMPDVSDWNWPVAVYPKFRPACWSPHRAEALFLQRWKEVNG